MIGRDLLAACSANAASVSGPVGVAQPFVVESEDRVVDR